MPEMQGVVFVEWFGGTATLLRILNRKAAA